jgi:hypothetical protein
MKLHVHGSGRSSRTPRELLLRLGRAVLWAAVAVVFVRGLAGVVTTEPQLASSRVVRVPSGWPDEPARAFATEFATAYLSVDPRDAVDTRARLGELAAPQVLDSLAPTLDSDALRQTVGSATVERAMRLDDRHALITVAASLKGARSRTLRLTVPVARDAHGGLVVNDLPSLAAAPSRAAAEPTSGVSLLGAERAAIQDVMTRFLRAFVSGDRAGLVYLAPPGTQVAATAGGFELLDLGPLTSTGPTIGPKRLVLATAHVRDRASRATYALRYRVRLVRRDRWYVAAINDPTGEGRVR